MKPGRSLPAHLILVSLGLGTLLLCSLGCYSSASGDARYRGKPSISLELARVILGGGPVYLPTRLTPEIVPLPTILQWSDSLPVIAIFYFDRAGRPALRLEERPCHSGYPCWGEQPPATPDGVKWWSLTIGDGTEVKTRIFPVQDLDLRYYDPEVAEYTWDVRLVGGTDNEGIKITLYSALSLSATLEIAESLVPLP